MCGGVCVGVWVCGRWWVCGEWVSVWVCECVGCVGDGCVGVCERWGLVGCKKDPM